MKKQRRPTIRLYGYTISLYRGEVWVARKNRKIVAKCAEWVDLIKNLK